jgi:hypothetical protein
VDRISEHISFNEATRSQIATRYGIPNIPNDVQLANMKIVAKACFEPIREWYGKPLIVSSFFRSEAVNKAVKGSKTSQHVQGKAIDVDAGSKEENKKIFDWAKSNLIYDQLINEYDYEWVHISFDIGHNRNQSFEVK